MLPRGKQVAQGLTHAPTRDIEMPYQAAVFDILRRLSFRHIGDVVLRGMNLLSFPAGRQLLRCHHEDPVPFSRRINYERCASLCEHRTWLVRMA